MSVPFGTPCRISKRYPHSLAIHWSPQSKTSADFFIDYCGVMQNIAEQCGGTVTADIYLKIFEDNVLNSYDKYIFIFFTDIYEISTSKKALS